MNLMEYYKKIYQFVLSRKNKFECKNSHFQSVIEPLSLDHPVLINSIYSKFSGKKGNEDCQEVFKGRVRPSAATNLPPLPEFSI